MKKIMSIITVLALTLGMTVSAGASQVITFDESGKGTVTDKTAETPTPTPTPAPVWIPAPAPAPAPPAPEPTPAPPAPTQTSACRWTTASKPRTPLCTRSNKKGRPLHLKSSLPQKPGHGSHKIRRFNPSGWMYHPARSGNTLYTFPVPPRPWQKAHRP